MIWLVCLAGGVGAVVRAGVDYVVTRRGPGWMATLGVNLAGSFLLGWASVALSGDWLAVVGAGFCGGLTTFSSACWQAARALHHRKIAGAVVYCAVTVVGCIAAAWIGTLVGA